MRHRVDVGHATVSNVLDATGDFVNFGRVAVSDTIEVTAVHPRSLFPMQSS